MQEQLHLLTSPAQRCLLPQAGTPTADLELEELTHRRLLRTVLTSLFTLRNTSRGPLQAKQALVDRNSRSVSTGLVDPVPLVA